VSEESELPDLASIFRRELPASPGCVLEYWGVSLRLR
jgi:hypothetical protein